MVKQGDIIKINFNPNKGHEQLGYRPAIVVSNNFFNSNSNMCIVCPITNTNNNFPLHIPLSQSMVTTGVVLCEHVRSIDLSARGYRYIEHAPDGIINDVLNTILAEIQSCD